MSPGDLGYGDARGAIALRTALSEYLARVRGVVAVPAQIIICTGFAQGLGVAVKALAKRGIRRIALEDPAQPDLSGIVSAAGMGMVRVPVDDEGLKCEPESTFWKAEDTEAAANRYAADLLMPPSFFRPRVAGKPAAFASVSELANLFTTSLSATAIRVR